MRMFVALEVPDPLKADLQEALQLFQRLSPGGINWVKPQNLHLTVNFIGDVQEQQVPALAKVIEDQTASFGASMLCAEGYELFPAKYPRLIWLKLSGANRDLQALNRKLLSAIRELHIDADPKALKLHITLGRIKSQQSPDFERAVMAHPVIRETMRWDTLSLYQSTLKPQGPSYTQIQQYNLK